MIVPTGATIGIVGGGQLGRMLAMAAAQLGYLLEGIDWRNPRHTWRPSAAG